MPDSSPSMPENIAAVITLGVRYLSLGSIANSTYNEQGG
jgi:hypothetical protein